MTKEENTAPAQTNQMPALYNQLVPLLKDLHKDLKLKKNQNFSFAANVNAVPIVMSELSMAVKNFPVVFAGDTSGVMLAVLGIKNGQNLFVDDEGKWRENTYIPTYIRRYPFYIARPDEKSDPIICIDDTSSFFSPDGENSLFDDGKPTDKLNRIIDFSRNYQHQLELTSEYGNVAEKMGMLEEQRVTFKADGDVIANVDGFKTIDRSKFDDLDAETLKEWLGKNWVDASILHFASGSNFDILWKLDRERNG